MNRIVPLSCMETIFARLNAAMAPKDLGLGRPFAAGDVDPAWRPGVGSVCTHQRIWTAGPATAGLGPIGTDPRSSESSGR